MYMCVKIWRLLTILCVLFEAWQAGGQNVLSVIDQQVHAAFIDAINYHPNKAREFLETQSCTVFIPPDKAILQSKFYPFYHMTNYAYTNKTLPRYVVSQYPSGVNLYITKIERADGEFKRMYVNDAEIRMGSGQTVTFQYGGEQIEQTIFYIDRVLHPLVKTGVILYEKKSARPPLSYHTIVLSPDVNARILITYPGEYNNIGTDAHDGEWPRRVKTGDPRYDATFWRDLDKPGLHTFFLPLQRFTRKYRYEEYSYYDIVRAHIAEDSILIPYAADRYHIRECKKPSVDTRQKPLHPPPTTTKKPSGRKRQESNEIISDDIMETDYTSESTIREDTVEEDEEDNNRDNDEQFMEEGGAEEKFVKSEDDKSKILSIRKRSAKPNDANKVEANNELANEISEKGKTELVAIANVEISQNDNEDNEGEYEIPVSSPLVEKQMKRQGTESTGAPAATAAPAAPDPPTPDTPVTEAASSGDADTGPLGQASYVCTIGFEYEKTSKKVNLVHPSPPPPRNETAANPNTGAAAPVNRRAFPTASLGLSIFELRKKNIIVRNGVIHIIDGVMCVINQTIVEFLKNPNIDQMKNFGQFSTIFDWRMLAYLDQVNEITVFVPMNKGIQEAYIRIATRRLATRRKKIEDVFTYHIIKGIHTIDSIWNSKTKKLKSISPPDTVLEFFFTADPNDEERPDVIIQCRGHNVTLELQDIRKTNGIIHMIDNLLGYYANTIYDKMNEDKYDRYRDTLIMGEYSEFNDQLKKRNETYMYFVPDNAAWDAVEMDYPPAKKHLFMKEFTYHSRYLMERHLVYGTDFTLQELYDINQAKGEPLVLQLLGKNFLRIEVEKDEGMV
uniref:FAS1 domain-containing protein n=1 Tax=Glossina brevipalpis TaxID=37001 RepID=A0A1A9WY49_9MUSC